MKHGTAKVACSCTHEQQDSMYGPKIRVANTTAKADDKADKQDVRCTVCSKIHTVSQDKIK
jgi:hypothetical protein